ncbi:MAG: hypothetical protein GF344_18135 [Chitinivibrionales bacterium]|nr:hypothetical protein [Chitinivibrionales bacterium]MBD3358577.1 hypothetical protein [Chitinivibrionales bacterium]
MRNPFRVCIIAPPGYRHSYAFIEIACLLKSSLIDLGRSCDLKLNEPAPNRINIVLGYHLIGRPTALEGYDYIPYQLEQLSVREGVYSSNIEHLLKNARSVWDYSRDNIAFLSHRGIAATLLPVGYHKNLERIVRGRSSDIDVLFYGSINERRGNVLDRLRRAGARVETAFGIYADERDRLVARAKIVLNVHHYSAQIFEQVRVSYLLNNRCPIVSEQSADNPYHKVDLCMVPYEQLVETCLDLLENAEKRERKALEQYEQFCRNYPMTGLLEPIINSGGCGFSA